MSKHDVKGRYRSPSGSRLWEYISATCCAMGMFCAGHILGWTSPSISEYMDPNSGLITITPEEASTIAAGVSIGHMIAPIFSIFIVDRFGRKRCMLMSLVPLILHWVLILFATNAAVLIVARILSGIFIGTLICAYPMYAGEILSPEIRGTLMAISSVMFYTGVLFMFGVAPALGVQWTACVCLASTIVFSICFTFVPESPYFLLMVGRADEAEATLEQLRGKTNVTDELEQIKATIDEKEGCRVESGELEINETRHIGIWDAFKQLFTIRRNRKALGITAMCSLLQHFCGLGVILTYCQFILEDMKSGIEVYTATMSFGVLQLLASCMTFLIVGRVGRRLLLFTSGVLSAISLFIIATFFYLNEHTNINVDQYSMIPLYALYFFVIVLNVGIMTVPGIIMSELFSSNVKALSNCIVSIFGASIGTSISMFYLLLVTTWGFGHSIPFYVFSLVTFFLTTIIVWILPETKGKTLLEIQKDLIASPERK